MDVDTFNILKPLFYFYKLHGLAPFYTEVKGRHMEFKTSKFSMAYVSFLFLISIFGEIFIIDSHKHDDRVLKFASVLTLSTFNTASTGIFLFTLMFHDKMLILLHMVCSKSSLIYKRDRIYVTLQLLGLLMVYASFITATFRVLYMKSTVQIFRALIIYISVMTVAVMNTILINILQILYRYFIELNVEMWELIHCTGNHTFLGKLKGIQMYSIKTSERPKYWSSENRSLMKIIKEINSFHNFACNVCDVFNSAFSLHALCLIACNFVMFTYFSYYVVIYIMKFEIEEPDRTSWLFIFMFLAFIFNMGLVILILFSNKTTAEAKRTPALVYKLIPQIEDPDVREELELFSLQLLHRKVEFTACGFFSLDFTLLYSIVGAVSTYLVILIQFELTFANDNAPNNTEVTSSTSGSSFTLLFSTPSSG